MKPTRTNLSLTCLLLSLGTLVARGDLVVAVPGQFEWEPGDASTWWPFGYFSDRTPSCRYQQVYDASEFAAITNGGGWINGLAFRLKGGTGLGALLPDIQINLSTTGREPDGMSLVFSENVGGNDTLVLGPGPFYLRNNVPGAPSGFPVLIELNQPFYYNPQAGNLLMDVRYNLAPPPGDPPGPFDASWGPGDSISSLFARGVGSVTGTADTIGLVTAFEITPVPEPGSLFLLALGLPAVFFAVCRKHKHNLQSKGETWHSLSRP
jgi:hypothetical protein